MTALARHQVLRRDLETPAHALGREFERDGAVERAGHPFQHGVPEALTGRRLDRRPAVLAPGDLHAVREVIERVLKAQGKWTELVAGYDKVTG